MLTQNHSHAVTPAPLDSTLHVMCQPPPSHNTSHMAYKSFTKLTVYSSTGCPPVSLSVTVTCTSLSDRASAVTVPMTGAVERETENVMKAAESRVYKDVRCGILSCLSLHSTICFTAHSNWYELSAIACAHPQMYTRKHIKRKEKMISEYYIDGKRTSIQWDSCFDPSFLVLVPSHHHTITSVFLCASAVSVPSTLLSLQQCCQCRWSEFSFLILIHCFTSLHRNSPVLSS